MTALVQQAPAAIGQWGMSRDQLDLLKRTIAQGTTDDEFALFMTTATRLGLDPFAKQIYAVKRPTYDKATGRYVDKMTIQVGIDGFRAVADRTGENDGQEGPFWCGDDGVWKDAWLHDEPPAAAMIRVFRKGRSKPFTGIATYRSYVQTTKDGKANRQWEQMPDVMLSKCAEALALRKAFPAQLSGVYAPEEMGQAENDNVRREPTTEAVAAALATPIDVESREVSGKRVQDEWQVAISMASTEDELRSLVPMISKLPEKEKTVARKCYGAQLTKVRQLIPIIDDERTLDRDLEAP